MNIKEFIASIDGELCTCGHRMDVHAGQLHHGMCHKCECNKYMFKHFIDSKGKPLTADMVL